MRLFRCALVVLCLTSAVLSYAQKEDWISISDQDKQFKDVPGDPGASAVRLFYRHAIDDNSFTEFIYERIKILNEKGRSPGGYDSAGRHVGGYADAQIPVLDDPDVFVTMTDFKARTVHPDGSIVEFTGKPFEKVIAKGRGIKVAVKAFAFPDVTVGSIVEYKYKLNFRTPWFSPFIVFSTDRWVAQSDLYTVKESLYFRPYEGGVAQSTTQSSLANEWDGAQISSVMANLKEKPKNKGNEYELELHDIPAFDAESYMPPEDNYKPSVTFFYSQRGSPTATEKAWAEIGKDRYERTEEFLGKNRGVKEAAMQAVSGESEPGMKLRKLYERAQQVHNLSYERERSEEERKKENIQRNMGVQDVLAHGYGNDNEINLLFIALARAAGFDASVVQVANRRRSFFNKELITRSQIDGIFAAVNLNGKDMYLEPGTRFCPYGVIPWRHTAIEGLKLDKKGGTFVKALPAEYDKSVLRRTADVSIAEDGTLKGDLTVEYKGYEALETRIEEVDSDDAGKKKDLEDAVKEWLPANALVKLASVEGWEGTDDPLVAHFNVEVPNYASVAGKRFLMPAYLFQGSHNEAFAHADRKYPIYFAYPFSEVDVVNAKIPAGFSVESLPAQQGAGLGYAKYASVTQWDGLQVVTQRKLLFNGMYFEPGKYSELKTFFNKVQAGDEQQAVLHGGSVSAQKGN